MIDYGKLAQQQYKLELVSKSLDMLLEELGETLIELQCLSDDLRKELERDVYEDED